LRIVDDDVPKININDVTLAEGDSGGPTAVFTVSLSSTSFRTVTVEWSTQAGTATTGSDFTPTSGQLTFSPGQTSKQILVPIKSDTVVEGAETFFVNLANATNAVIAGGQGVGTIVDDDALILLTEANSDRAIALDSVLFTRDPFPINNGHYFSADRRTRVALFAIGLKLLPGEDRSAVTATAEDSQGNIRPLTVEFVGGIPSFDWLMQLVLKQNDQPTSSGDVRVKITLHRLSSNVVRVGIQP
jgi:hypothetical protein